MLYLTLVEDRDANRHSVIKPWMIFVSYEVVNIVCGLFNFHSKTLPALTLFTLWTSIISFLVIIVAVPSKAPSQESAGFVFTTFVNNTGWKSNGMAFIVGLINPNWAFNGLDCATHMAEEVLNPERVIPIAILGTVGIGFITAWTFSIGMLFSIQDFDQVAGTATGVPILELFLQALNSKAGAVILCSLIILTGCGCLIASHTWQARLCWSFARDDGLPMSKHLAHIHPKLRVPVNAHIASCGIVSVLGCLYLASYTACKYHEGLFSLYLTDSHRSQQHGHRLRCAVISFVLHSCGLPLVLWSIEPSPRAVLARKDWSILQCGPSCLVSLCARCKLCHTQSKICTS